MAKKSVMQRINNGEIKPLSNLPAGTPVSWKLVYIGSKWTKGAEATDEQKAKAKRVIHKALFQITSHQNVNKASHMFMENVDGDNEDFITNCEQAILGFAKNSSYDYDKHGDFLSGLIDGADMQSNERWKGITGYGITSFGKPFNGEEPFEISAFIDKDEYERRLELTED